MGFLDTTKGNNFIRQTLLQAISNHQLPRQLLFVGPEGIGKKRVAWGLSEVLLCLNFDKISQKTCGQCSSCIKIQSGFHENVLSIEPEKNTIKLEKADEIQGFLCLAHDQGARIVIVNDAHTLNAQASNSLLKVIEEPPPHTYFFFITHRWMQVLPTIRSRSTKIPFSPLSENELKFWCNETFSSTSGKPPFDPHLLRRARGSVSELLNQKQEDQIQLRNDAHNMLIQFFKEKDYFLLGSWREEVKDKEKLILFIRHWLFMLHDRIFSQYAKMTLPAFEEAENALNALSLDEMWYLWNQGLHLEPGVLAHRDSVLLIENWLIPVLELKSEFRI